MNVRTIQGRAYGGALQKTQNAPHDHVSSRKNGRPVGNAPAVRREWIREHMGKVTERAMAERLGISRTAVQKHIRAIRG